MKEVYVSGAALTPFGKREQSLEELVREAVQNLKNGSTLENADEMDRIDAVCFGNMSGEKFTGISNLSAWVTDHLGLSGKPAIRIDTASSSGAAVFQAGCRAIASGQYQRVLVVAGEKMTHVPSVTATGILAGVIDPYERDCGCTMTALAAMVTRRYMESYGMTAEELALVAVKNHHNGSLNPHAQFQKPVSLEKVMDSRIIASPLRLYDCSPISDGAAAMILTSRPTRVRVRGIGHGTDHVAFRFRESLTSFRATKLAADRAYRMANVRPDKIDVAEVHDAFTSFEIIDTEDLGFFEPGKGVEALVNGTTQLDGELPINPSGGLKSRGHPVGASGLAQVVEIVWQLEGKAGRRQVKGAKMGLTQSIGGFASSNLVNILEAV
jgi:acetyl-CoA C-acetyltransferase